MNLKTLVLAAASAFGLFAAQAAHAADKLDNIIESGKLRCAVVLDFPPMGSRDSSNNPVNMNNPSDPRHRRACQTGITQHVAPAQRLCQGHRCLQTV